MNSDDILGIKNRTENWETARTFAPLITCSRKRYEFARHIISNHYSPCPSFGEEHVMLELFWKGFRDLIKLTAGASGKSSKARKAAKIKEVADIYRKHFHDLRTGIEEYISLAETQKKQPKLNLKPDNYVCKESDTNEPDKSELRLYDNLINTEIDIVVSAPGFLLIGEAKEEASFDGNSESILAHQLIREHVMADIVLQMKEPPTKTEIISFVVGDDVEGQAQVKCMLDMGWLVKENIISWNDVKNKFSNRLNESEK